MQSAKVSFTDTECVVEHIENLTLKLVVKNILHRSHPIIIGVKVLNGVLKPEMVLKAKLETKYKYLGEVMSLERDRVDILEARPSEEVIAAKIDSHGVDVHVHHDLIDKELTEAHLRLEVVEIFHKKDPMILGVEVKEGVLTPGTRIEVGDDKHKVLGEVVSLEKDHESISMASEDAHLGEIGVKIIPTPDAANPKHVLKPGIEVVEHHDDILDMEETDVIHAKNPLILSCKVNHGVVREGDIVELVHKDFAAGKVVSIERQHKKLHSASASDDLIGIQIEPTREMSKLLGHKHMRKELNGTHMTNVHTL